MILDQRSDIEQFFLESLDQVRNENYKALKNVAREEESLNKNFKLPDIS
jgi:hypothetical protein